MAAFLTANSSKRVGCHPKIVGMTGETCASLPLRPLGKKLEQRIGPVRRHAGGKVGLPGFFRVDIYVTDSLPVAADNF